VAARVCWGEVGRRDENRRVRIEGQKGGKKSVDLLVQTWGKGKGAEGGTAREGTGDNSERGLPSEGGGGEGTS